MSYKEFWGKKGGGKKGYFMKGGRVSMKGGSGGRQIPNSCYIIYRYFRKQGLQLHRFHPFYTRQL